MATSRPGTLHVVATPIGNIGDLTTRAREVLASVDVVAAEDTRHTGQLLSTINVTTSLLPLHEHNEDRQIPGLIERMRRGEHVAVVSDAGTPGISDPGFPLVRAALNAGLPVVAVPGACAAVAALSVSGQPTDRFVFEGFLPARGAARRKRLETLRAEQRTIVLYESCHRIRETLADLADVFGGDRSATFARELTKMFETVWCDSLSGLITRVGADSDQRRGEIVLVIAGNSETDSGADHAALLDALLTELPPARAAAVAAKITGVSRRSLYRQVLARGHERSE